MSDVQIYWEFRQVLAELEMLSHGTTQNYAPAHGSDGGGDGFPPGEGRPPHLKWAAEWAAATDDDRRQAVVRLAREELVSFRKRDMTVVTRPVESQDELEDRVVEEGKGWTVVETALHCRVTPRFVRRARRKAEVNEFDGKDIAKKGAVSRMERQREAREMKARGMTLRQIAMHFDCDAATIARDLAA